jgi:hypothetical protein
MLRQRRFRGARFNEISDTLLTVRRRQHRTGVTAAVVRNRPEADVEPALVDDRL